MKMFEVIENFFFKGEGKVFNDILIFEYLSTFDFMVNYSIETRVLLF